MNWDAFSSSPVLETGTVLHMMNHGDEPGQLRPTDRISIFQLDDAPGVATVAAINGDSVMIETSTGRQLLLTPQLPQDGRVPLSASPDFHPQNWVVRREIKQES